MGIVVVGAGLAAASAIDELRSQGYSDRIVLIGAERHLPYERPPLSKGVLLGDSPVEDAFVHDQGWYNARGVELMLGSSASAIGPDRRRVKVGEESVSYDALLLTTGAAPRHLPELDRSGLDVAYLRTIEDALLLKERLQGSIVIVGAGWIGLEVAAAASEAGASVTVVERAGLPLVGAVGTEVGGVFAALHREHGVDLRLGTRIAGVEGHELVLDPGEGAQAAGGERLTPDLVVVGIGAVPQDRLAAAAGLAVDNGILVDGRLQSSDPGVFAAGDVANHDHPSLGRLRVEHWDNAIEQGRHAARSMLGESASYARQPYFFSDQYDLGMEFLGRIPAGAELVVRGDLRGRVFTACWVAEGVVAAGMHVNSFAEMGHIRELVGKPADPRLRDASVPLADLRP